MFIRHRLSYLFRRLGTPLFIAVLLLLPGGPAARAELVFDSSSTVFPLYLPGTSEIGDEITLAGEARTVTGLRFDYYLDPRAGNTVTGRVRIYLNNGAGFPPRPQEVLYSSPSIALATGYANVQVSGVALDVPESFTVAILFQNVPANLAGRVGPVFYGEERPAIGRGFDDYWVRQTNGVWLPARFPNGQPPVHFSMLVEAQPDPPVRLLSVTPTNGVAALTLSGPITSNVVVEAAAEVAGGWQAFSTNRFTNGPIRLVTPDAVTNGARFYRARLP
jgi:hypothetical protein